MEMRSRANPRPGRQDASASPKRKSVSFEAVAPWASSAIGCGPGALAQSRIAGVPPASVTFSTWTPGSMARESAAPAIRLTMAAAVTHRLARALTTFVSRFDDLDALLYHAGCGRRRTTQLSDAGGTISNKRNRKET